MDQTTARLPSVQRSPGIQVELRPEMPVVLQIPRDGAKYSSKIVGVEPYKYIIAKMPLAPGIRTMIFPGQGLTLKSECDGIIYGFDTEILHAILRPAALLLLAYPMRTEKIELRRHRRLSCLLPVRLQNPFAHTLAFMVDISLGGCRLVVDKNDTDGILNVMAGDEVSILALHEVFGDDGLRATIANTAQKNHKAFFGAAFAGNDPDHGRRVAAFLDRIAALIKDQKGG